MFIKRVPQFEYHVPASLGGAHQLLSRYGRQARLMAGGTDLLGAMKRRDMVVGHLINLKGIKGLEGIDFHETAGLKIGGLTRLGDLERSAVVRDKYAILMDALDVMASPQIRNLATIGGNLCGAVPSADTAPPLIALRASVVLYGHSGQRTVLVENLFKGPGESILGPDEILTRIIIPPPAEFSGGAYIKLMTRNAMELAIVGVAVHLSLDKDGKTCRQATIALGAVGPTPLRALQAEKVLGNRAIHEELAKEAGKAASREASPISNIRATKEYRTEMIGVLTARAVMKAYERIRKNRTKGGQRT